MFWPRRASARKTPAKRSAEPSPISRDWVSSRSKPVRHQATSLGSRQVTDTYLLGMTMHHGAVLAALDPRLVTNAVIDGGDYLHVIS